MRTVREGCFETNSSSTHTLVLCNDAELKKFKAGKLFANKYNECGNVMDTAELVDIDFVADVYERKMHDCDYGDLPVLTKSQLRELMVDPLRYDDYDYKRPDTDPHFVVWDLSRHRYSKALQNIITETNHTGIYYVFREDEFPKSYEYLLRETADDERSEKKMNVLDFEIWY